MNPNRAFILIAIILLTPLTGKAAGGGTLLGGLFSSGKTITEPAPTPKADAKPVTSSDTPPSSTPVAPLESACTTEWKGTFPECRFIPIDDPCTLPRMADCRDSDGSEALWVISGYACDASMPASLPRAYPSRGDRSPVINAGATVRASCESVKGQCFDRADSCERGTAPGALPGSGCPYLPPVKCRVPEGINQELTSLLHSAKIEPTLIVYDYVPGSLEGVPRVLTADEHVTSGMIIQSPNPELIQCISSAVGRDASWRR